MARRNHDFQTIRSEGGLLPPDLLRRVLDPKAGLDGTTPADYGLASGERLNIDLAPYAPGRFAGRTRGRDDDDTAGPPVAARIG